MAMVCIARAAKSDRNVVHHDHCTIFVHLTALLANLVQVSLLYPSRTL
ncbi:hypothetical protein GMES_0430 [Paraglaciecola mesophila KMM 241]|uniref:Uncharacterized protein n=1 Tax=Paraglaciecola mesophila KMM 241 TaxID=1128912 RepID=K6YFH5_9ALTE|nr:hypothetical protein GMES_0430 [Paraglaciecola mesophila KMM 241]